MYNTTQFLTGLLEDSAPCRGCEQSCGGLDSVVCDGIGFVDIARHWREQGIKDSLASTDILTIAASRYNVE
jgi:hypothetical protein